MQVVSCKLHYNVLVLVVFDAPWSKRPLLSERYDVVLCWYSCELSSDYLVHEEQLLFAFCILGEVAGQVQTAWL